jgi:hypothetical protein
MPGLHGMFDRTSNACISMSTMSPTEFFAQQSYASDTVHPTLGNMPKATSWKWNSVNMGRTWLLLSKVIGPVATFRRMLRCLCPSLLIVITRIATSWPSRVRAILVRGFYIQEKSAGMVAKYHKGRTMYSNCLSSCAVPARPCLPSIPLVGVAYAKPLERGYVLPGDKILEANACCHST